MGDIITTGTHLWLSPRNSSLSKRLRRSSLSPFWFHCGCGGCDDTVKCKRTWDGQPEGRWFVVFPGLHHTFLHISTLGQFVFLISKARRPGIARCWKPTLLIELERVACFILRVCMSVQLLILSAEFRNYSHWFCMKIITNEKKSGTGKRDKRKRRGYGDVVMTCKQKMKTIHILN